MWDSPGVASDIAVAYTWAGERASVGTKVFAGGQIVSDTPTELKFFFC